MRPSISYAYTTFFVVVVFLQFLMIAALIIRLIQIKKQLKKPVPDETASELMRDLLNGGAIAVVKVIDPKSMFLFSPRDHE